MFEMQQVKKIIPLVSVCVFLIALLEQTCWANSEFERHQIMGKISDSTINHIEVEGAKFYFRTNSIIYSQAYHKISSEELKRGSFVDISYYKMGKYYIIDKVKLLDLVGKADYKKISGRIVGANQNNLRIGRQIINIDDFTIKLGLKLQQSNLNTWKNMYVTVVALKNDIGEWTAEIVRQGKPLEDLAYSHLQAE